MPSHDVMAFNVMSYHVMSHTVYIMSKYQIPHHINMYVFVRVLWEKNNIFPPTYNNLANDMKWILALNCSLQVAIFLHKLNVSCYSVVGSISNSSKNSTMV